MYDKCNRPDWLAQGRADDWLPRLLAEGHVDDEGEAHAPAARRVLQRAHRLIIGEASRISQCRKSDLFVAKQEYCGR
jgi:hypothetical protein